MKVVLRFLILKTTFQFLICQNMIKFSLSIVLIIASLCTYGQNKFHVDFYAEDCLKKRELSFSFDDGEKMVPAQVVMKGKQYSIEGLYFGKFTFLEIGEKIDSTLYISKRYLLNEIPAKIQYGSCDTTNSFIHWKDIQCENAKSLMPFFDSSILYTMNELNKVNEEQIKVNKAVSDSISIGNSKSALELALNNLFNKQFEFTKLHTENYMAFIYFRDIINQKSVLDSDNIWGIFDAFPNNLRNSFEGRKLFKLIEEKRKKYDNAPKVGKLAPNFQAIDILGKKIKLADFKGKHILLVFWATWCGPCVQEIPIIKSIRDKYKPSELSIVYISEDTDKSKMLSFIKKRNMNWIHIFGNKLVAKDYFVNGIPEILLIDPNSKIIYLNIGTEFGALNKKLSENIR